MKKETVYKIIAIVVIPGAIPIYLSYKAFQLGKHIYKEKLTNKGEENEEHIIGNEPATGGEL